MQNNSSVTVYTARSRKDKQLQPMRVTWPDFFQRLSNSRELPVSLAAYKALKKAQQDDLKDVGAYVAGELKSGYRRSGCVLSRCAAVLDADNLPAGTTEDFVRRVDALGCCYALHSTAKHSPSTPRLRVIIPFAESIPAEQYPLVVRLLCRLIQAEMNWFDPTCDEPGRIMYYASHCQDITPIWYSAADRPLLDALQLAGTFAHRQDIAQWPRFPRETSIAKLAAKQKDPESKENVVGAFCRVYNVLSAMDKFLPGVYEPTAQEDRWTYAEGSTSGGAVIYDGGKFLYSHHATDPCSGKLVNAFDLVRLHRFADLDDEAAPGTPPGRMPSYREMALFAQSDPAVLDELNRAKMETARNTFTAVDESGASADNDVSWMRNLRRNANGDCIRCVENIELYLENDPQLKGKMYKDLFNNRIYGEGAFPWGTRCNEKTHFVWTDEDDTGLAVYLNTRLGFYAPGLVHDMRVEIMERHARDPVKDYLNGLTWDGVERLDTLLIDYLGADDTPYTRAVTRMVFTAAVARVMTPGCKFDYMLVLAGRQGIGKSTLIRYMGDQWYSDTLQSFEGKSAAEQLIGVWLQEVAELQAMYKSTLAQIKRFISSPADYFRRAYARCASNYPRRCVFIGTTNETEFLSDPTGNRRFLPVNVGVNPTTKSVFTELLGERDQLWAEAVTRWKTGGKLYLSDEIEKVAKQKQEAATDIDAREGEIREFLEIPLPEGWRSWTVDQRRMYLASNAKTEDVSLSIRKRVCACEVRHELYGLPLSNKDQRETRQINNIIRNRLGWEGVNAQFPPYGQQRGFERPSAKKAIESKKGDEVDA